MSNQSEAYFNDMEKQYITLQKLKTNESHNVFGVIYSKYSIAILLYFIFIYNEEEKAECVS